MNGETERTLKTDRDELRKLAKDLENADGRILDDTWDREVDLVLHGMHKQWPPPKYTKDLTTAAKMIPQGWRVDRIYETGERYKSWIAMIRCGSGKAVVGRANTEAAARCAAALYAMAEEM
jgi:hypothetical protein